MQEDTSKDLEKLGVNDLETFKQRQDETEKAYIKRMNALGEHQKGYYKGEIDVDRVNRIARVRRQVASFEEPRKEFKSKQRSCLKYQQLKGFLTTSLNLKMIKEEDLKLKNYLRLKHQKI